MKLVFAIKGTISFLVTISSFLSLRTLGGQDNPFARARQVSNARASYIMGVKVDGKKDIPGSFCLGDKPSKSPLGQFFKKAGIKRLDLIYTLESNKNQKWRHFIEQRFKLPKNDISKLQIAEFTFSNLGFVSEGLKLLRSNEKVLFVEKNYINRLSEKVSEETSRKVLDFDKIYKDYFFWWQEQIFFPRVFHLLRQEEGFERKVLAKPVIAIIDSGLDVEHPIFKQENIWHNPAVGQVGCGNDLYGCHTALAVQEKIGSPDIFPYGTNKAGEACLRLKGESECAHGTQVAGLIAGRTLSQGSLGLCPSCQLMTLKALSQEGGDLVILDSSILRALKYIVLINERIKNPVRLINLSFGKYKKSQAISLFLYYLRKEHNILTIAAAGNEKTQKPLYPAALKHVLAVAATNSFGKRASYSNYGPWVNIFAPGGSHFQGIRSSIPGGGESVSSGTSLAAPLVTGGAGFLLSLKPELNVDELESLLLSLNKKSNLTHNILNMEAALYSLLQGNYKKEVERKKTRVEPFCGQIVEGFSFDKFHLKFLSIWFILLLPLILIGLTRHQEVKL